MTDSRGIRCMMMRGGTSKGAYFVASDLPADVEERDALLLRIMGSPDPRQIDGIGGAHPLTSKVAIVSRAASDTAQLDYLFLQLGVDEALVTDRQNCGNLLAGVAPFALERGLIEATDDVSEVRIFMCNTGAVATAKLETLNGAPKYGGDTAIAGVPGTAAPIRLYFENIAGSSCGALLPTGHAVDEIEGVTLTCIDNGMPVIVMTAQAMGIEGNETPQALEANATLRERLEAIRLVAGPLMNLGDVKDATVPKLTLVSVPREEGNVATRTFIPHRCHEAIGVLGAVSVATACLLRDTPAAEVASIDDPTAPIRLEHPTGSFDAVIDMDPKTHEVRRAGVVRTARKLFDGVVFPRD